MEPRRIRQGVPVWQIRDEPLYSTYRASFDNLLFSACGSIAAYLYDIYARGARADIFHASILFALGHLAYLLVWKRRNHKIIAEGGLYIVKRGYAILISWEKVNSAQIVRDVPDFIGVDLMQGLMDEQTGTPVVLEEKDWLRFPYDRKAVECFRRFVPVSGDKIKRKKRRDREMEH